MFLIKLITVISPWPVKRVILKHVFGYNIAEDARVGLSWIFPDKMDLGKGARIGAMNVAIHLHHIRMGEYATIGRNNWITGYPKEGRNHFTHKEGRDPSLHIGNHSAITKNHHLDCTDRLEIGSFTTIAGYRSQFLTHSINIEQGIQDCRPITIGSYAFIGTSVVVLGGSVVPDCSVVAAGAVVSKAFEEKFSLYGGVPAKHIKWLPSNSRYFTRETGFVD